MTTATSPATPTPPAELGLSPIPGLLPHHYRELHVGSGLSDETIRAAGIFSETDHIKLALVTNRKKWDRKMGPAMVFPYRDATGAVVLNRVKPDRPGDGGKYLAPAGSIVRAYIPEAVRPFLGNPAQPIIVTEGEKKTLTATQAGFPTIGLSGVDCWHVKKSTALIPDLEHVAWKGREVFIVFDSDAADNPRVRENESLLGATLGAHGAKVRVVRLPPGPQNGDGKAAKVGLDDYLVAHGADALRKLLTTATEPEKPAPSALKVDAGKLDPATVADDFLTRAKKDGQSRLRWWRGTPWYWQAGAYREKSGAEVRASLIRYVNNFASRLSSSVVNNLVDQVKAQSILDGRNEPPAWIAEPPADAWVGEGPDAKPWPEDEILVTKSSLIHLPSLAAGKPRSTVPATPRFFSTSALDFDFRFSDAPSPENWYRFLGQLWPDDPQSVATLQEWFGYCLTPDTRQQKIALLVGPKRSGKGTIARVLTALLGQANVCAPTLASFGTNFGLAPLIGKRAAIIADARLGGKADQSAVAERLLSISGEDSITVDRKFLPAWTGRLGVRFILLSNELPRIADASGALASRFIVWTLTESFYGKEDHGLTDRLLSELPAILNWAIAGWQRLRERGYFVQPSSSFEAIQELEDLGSPINAFLRERCEVKTGAEVEVETLFLAWQQWCKDQGRDHTGNLQSFGRDLRAALPKIRDTRPREGEVRIRKYSGLRLLAAWESVRSGPRT